MKRMVKELTAAHEALMASIHRNRSKRSEPQEP
jgi:hypothetical protein